MRVRRRTAVLLCVGVLLAGVAFAGWLFLRPERIRLLLRDALQGMVREGHSVEVAGARLGEGWSVEAEGVVLRHVASGRELFRAKRLRVDTRLLQFLERGKITEIEVEDPVVSLERGAGEGFPLLEAMLPGEGADAGLPRIRVHGGTVRFSDPEVLQPGAALELGIEEIAVEESRPGQRASFRGTFRERLLGPVRATGDVTPGTGGFDLQVDVQSFRFEDALHARLGGPGRGFLDAFVIKGTVGDPADPKRPGFALRLARKGPDAPFSVTGVARPAGLSVLFKGFKGKAGFPLEFTGVRGEVLLERGRLSVPELEARRGDAVLRASGSVSPLDATAEVELRFGVEGLALDGELRDALPPAAQRVFDAYTMGGRMDVDREFSWLRKERGEGAPVRLHVASMLRGGEASFRGYADAGGRRRGFDWPVVGLTGRLGLDLQADGSAIVVLDGIRGTHGPVAVRVSGKVHEFGPGRTRAEVHVDAEDVPLDADVRRAFGDRAGEVFDRWAPEGVAGRIHVLVFQDEVLDRKAHESVTIELDGRASFSYEGFPLRIEEVRGTVEDAKDRTEGRLVPRTTLRGIRGRRGPASFAVDGTVWGDEDRRIALSIRVEDVPLDGPLEEAVRKAPQGAAAVSVWDRLRPSGRADIAAELSGSEASPIESYRVDLRGAKARGWDGFAFPLEDLRGTVEVLPDAVVIRGVRGRGPEGDEVRIEGRVDSPGASAALDLRLEMDGLALDESLRPRLGPAADRLAGFFEFVRPAEGLRADTAVHLEGPAAAPRIAATFEGIRGGIAPLGLRNLDLGGGRATLVGDEVVIEGLEGSMAGREFRVEKARLDVRSETAELGVAVRQLRFPRDLAGLLPEETVAALERLVPNRFFHAPDLRIAIDQGWRRVVLGGTVTLSPLRTGFSPGLGLEGEFALDGVTLLQGEKPGEPAGLSGALGLTRGVLAPGVRLDRIAARLALGGSVGAGGGEVTADVTDLDLFLQDRRLRGGSCRLSLADGAFRLEDLRGTFAGGALTGSFAAGEPGVAWKGKLDLQGAGARALISPADPESRVEGTVNGNVWFRNGPGTALGLEGKGRFDLKDGAFVDVPLFSAFIRAFGGSGTFSEGTLKFEIAGDQLRLGPRDLFLDSPFYTLETGKASTIGLDGRLDLWIDPTLKLPGPLDWIKEFAWNPIFRRFTLFRVEGTLANPGRPYPALFPDLRGESAPVLRAPEPTTEVPLRPPIDF